MVDWEKIKNDIQDEQRQINAESDNLPEDDGSVETERRLWQLTIKTKALAEELRALVHDIRKYYLAVKGPHPSVL